MMHAGGGVPTMAYYSYSNQNSPAVETANKENPFDFPTVNIPPRLKNIGRKISQMSNDFLPPNVTPDEEEPTRKLERRRSLDPDPVPGMGDEPVMCPFCNKPLPPSLLASQLLSGKHDHNHQNRPSNIRRASSMRVSSNTSSPRITPSAPLSRVPSADTPPANPVKSQLLDPLPVKTPEPIAKIPEDPLPSATSETFAETVKEGDVANHDAAEKMITEEDIKRWSTLSGITLPSSSSSTTTAKVDSTPIVAPIPKPAENKKAFPLLPPPPAAASKLTKPPPTDRPSSTSSSSKFKFFAGKKEEDDEEESDDEGAATGYTKLTGPASDSEDEESTKRRTGKKVEEPMEPEVKDFAETKDEKSEDVSSPGSNYSELADEKKPAEGAASDPDEVKRVLQEVLGRVNDLSKSQAALLASHSTLLTSLKIARSNLAMAEANSEMLEAQLKRASATPTGSKAGTSRNVSGPATTAPGTPQLAPSAPAPAPARSSADHVRATTTANTVASPASAARVPGRASMEERPRPTSLHITANELAGAGSGGLSAPSSSGGLNSSSNSNSWGFWNGGKKKVTGALSHVHVPSASSVIDAFQQPSRPGTPNPDGHPRKSTESISNWIPTSPSAPYSVPISSAPRPAPNRTSTHHSVLSKSFNDQPSLSRSMSVMNVPSVAGQRSVSARTSSSVSSEELSTLRQAYSAAVAKMDGMSKELAELKKGKVEMEAELENLSQALFEEANKMVADERRRVAELEDSLKEVKEEREALRDTIKVLGGKVEDIPKISHPNEHHDEKRGEGEQEEEDEDEEEEFRPRDLDKHYAALRKSIHHVASGADLHDEEEEEESGKIPLVSEPTPITPSLGNSIALGLEVPSTRSSTATSTSEDERPLSMSMPSLPAAAENNPWATSTSTYDPPRINVKAATPSPHMPVGGLPELPSDKAGEGEAPSGSGLGLESDSGLVEGQVQESKE
ncbi:hypothetical protein I302_104155 [Kwoniella bestiolae CBS 10118]|uniref:GDP/GTP exchange factor Sec2 N-terminal domain-containing protein n=1 Tax=Kwoniella bestiolae CBS 10118 TaxID=1296100 RepID=A0A1B9GAG5_9TREE|nr:hypothetical protein I302_02862 [Kwoniella bestiolae CBS 10118]OCF28011.1 hypothetical protein I302_02862 [Kwoniella bestiolae CBS 10118]